MKVITYGTFDLLHYGHIELLRRAKEKGDYLIVALSSDKFNNLKGKSTYFDYNKRKLMLEAIRYVDEVIEEDSWEQKKFDVQNYKINKFVIGSDWKGEFDYLSEFCEVEYLERTKEISTSKIKQELAIKEIV